MKEIILLVKFNHVSIVSKWLVSMLVSGISNIRIISIVSKVSRVTVCIVSIRSIRVQIKRNSSITLFTYLSITAQDSVIK